MKNVLKALLGSKKDPALSFTSGEIQKDQGGFAVCFVAVVSTVRLQQLRKSSFSFSWMSTGASGGRCEITS